jgi:hypothetical protein
MATREGGLSGKSNKGSATTMAFGAAIGRSTSGAFSALDGLCESGGLFIFVHIDNARELGVHCVYFG